MTEIQKKLGLKIKSLRRLKDYTQEALGERAGLSYKFIGEIERGEVNPSLRSLIGIAKALEIDVADLFPRKADVAAELSIEEIKAVKKSLEILTKYFSRL